jgi:arylsulfatase A-like enzyme
MRPAISIASFVTCWFLLAAPSSHAQKAGNKPNIIYIMADDLGYADLSCYGRKDYQTPHLDQLATEGVKLVNAYAAAPVCTPTRTAFLTGRYPARTEVGLHEPLDWASADSVPGLTPTTTSMATLMKRAGYKTYLVGKWHLGFNQQSTPTKNGFDYFFGFKGGGLDYISHTAPRGKPDLYENETPIVQEGYLTDLLRDKTLDIINASHSQPFFLTLMFNAPHWPWQAPGDGPYPDTLRWKLGGTKATYAAMVQSMDKAVGLIMKALEDKHLAKNTIVIFTSDNGGERYSDMGPYKDGKMTLWEGGTREPAFVRWPGVIQPNTTSLQVATTMDWTATILHVAGAKADPRFPLDGINLLPVLTGKQPVVDRTLYWRISQRKQQKAMRSGSWKYLQDDKGEYLFNLAVDPTETNNLAIKQPAKLAALKKKYKWWETTVLAPLPLTAADK